MNMNPKSLNQFSKMLCFFFLFLLLSSLSSTTTPIHAKTLQQQSDSLPPSESETLFKIMESMSSDQPWRLNHPNPCNPGSSWPGLECKLGKDNFAHVSKLHFGSPPNPSCKPTASFPYLIFSLPFLQSLFFLNCFTHTITSISIPLTNVFCNASLQQLSLRSNPSLIGPIPTRISSFKSLEILSLSQNRLTGNIPPGVLSLDNLVHLDLSYNRLAGSIPYQLGNLKKLVGLDLSYNSISGSIPISISRLSQLQKLDLSSNSLVGRIPFGFEKLSSLSFVALSNNRLKGPFPKGISSLQNLQYFIMDDNPMFIPLPTELGFLVRLQELRLANSGYSGEIPESYSQLKNLSSLSLQNNRLTGGIPPGFSSLPRIFHLNLSRNMMSGVVPFDSGFFRRLGKNLDLSGNPGLCVNAADQYRVVKAGVDLCGKNKTSGSLIHPLEKSQAPNLFEFCNSVLFQVGGTGFLFGFHHLFR